MFEVHTFSDTFGIRYFLGAGKGGKNRELTHLNEANNYSLAFEG